MTAFHCKMSCRAEGEHLGSSRNSFIGNLSKIGGQGQVAYSCLLQGLIERQATIHTHTYGQSRVPRCTDDVLKAVLVSDRETNSKIPIFGGVLTLMSAAFSPFWCSGMVLLLVILVLIRCCCCCCCDDEKVRACTRSNLIYKRVLVLF